jgi:hypothetical protein
MAWESEVSPLIREGDINLPVDGVQRAPFVLSFVVLAVAVFLCYC